MKTTRILTMVLSALTLNVGVAMAVVNPVSRARSRAR